MCVLVAIEYLSGGNERLQMLYCAAVVLMMMCSAGKASRATRLFEFALPAVARRPACVVCIWAGVPSGNAPVAEPKKSTETKNQGPQPINISKKSGSGWLADGPLITSLSMQLP